MAGRGQHFLSSLFSLQIGQSRSSRCAEQAGRSCQELAEVKAANSSMNMSAELSGQSRSTFLMAFSPDGTMIASTHGDHSVRITEVKTGRCLHVLTGHPRTPWCVAFHPASNDILASGCLGGEVRIWDLRGGGTEVWKSEKGYVISSISFHPTDQVLVIATTNEILFWDWTQAEPFARCKSGSDYERVRWVKFDALGQYLLTGIANGTTVQREDISYSNPTSDGVDTEERQQLRARYRSIVNHMNHFSAHQRELRQRHGSAARYGQHHLLMPPTPVRLEVSGPHAVDVDIVQPSSPVHLEALHDARLYAARITREANQSLLNPDPAESSPPSDLAARASPPHGDHVVGGANNPIITVDPPDYSTLSLDVAQQELNNNSLHGVPDVVVVRRAEPQSGMDDEPGLTLADESVLDLPDETSASDYSPSSGLRLLAEASGAISQEQHNDGRMSGTGDEVGHAFGLRSLAPHGDVAVNEAGNMLQSPFATNTISANINLTSNIDVSRGSTNTFTPIGSDSPVNAVICDSEVSSVTQVAADIAADESAHSVTQLPADEGSSHTPSGDMTSSRFVPLSDTEPQNSLLRFHLTAAPQSSSGQETTEDLNRSLPGRFVSATATTSFTQHPTVYEHGQHNDSNSNSSQNSNQARPWTLHPVDLDESNRCDYGRCRVCQGPFMHFPCPLQRGRSESRSSPAVSTSQQHRHNMASSNNNQNNIPSLVEACQNSRLSERLRQARLLRQHMDDQMSAANSVPEHRSHSRTNESEIYRSDQSALNEDGRHFADQGRTVNRQNESASTSHMLPNDLHGDSFSNVTDGRADQRVRPNLYTEPAADVSMELDSASSSLANPHSSSDLSESRNFSHANLQHQMNQLNRRASEIQRNLSERLRLLREERRNDNLQTYHRGNSIRGRHVEHVREYQDHLRSRLDDIRQRYMHRRSVLARDNAEMSDMSVRAENTITHAERELRGMREELSRIQSRAGQQQEWLAHVQDRQRQLHCEIHSMREEMIRRRQQQRERDRSWHTLQRRHLHPHYAISIVDDTLNNRNDGLQAAINRAIAGAFMGTGEGAVASNIVDLTHRIQRWDFNQCRIPDITCADVNVVVPHCKLHNDASCDISQDGQRLATFVPTHNGFPDDTVLAVFSLEANTLGQCLFTKSFGPNAISVSISPLNNFVLVGLAAKRLAWVFTPNQMVGQVFQLKTPLAGEASMQHVADVMHPCELDLRTHVSVNSARWLPGIGEGLVYGTNRGDLHICQPAGIADVKCETSMEAALDNEHGPSTLRRNLFEMLGMNTPRTISIATQTVANSVRRSAATQTEQLNQSDTEY